MRETAMALAAAAALILAAGNAGAQCTKDTDCKGNRICSGGACVESAAAQPAAPAPSPAPAPKPAPAPEPRGPLSFFQTGYGSVGVLFDFHGWGGSTEEYESREFDSDLESDFALGVRLAGYAAVSEHFHIGGYWTFLKPDVDVDPDGRGLFGTNEESDVDMIMNMLGLSLKFGTTLAERIWLGAAVDAGVLFAKGEVDVPFGGNYDMKTMVGLGLHPQAELEVLIVDTGAFRLAFLASLGLLVAPIVAGHPYDEDDWEDDLPFGDEIDVTFWWLSPVMMLGLAAGS